MKTIDIHSSNGTGLMGYLKCDFQSLLYAFGDHRGGSVDGKVRAEWLVDSPAGCIRIYDYKNSKPVDELTSWHVGGHSELVLNELARLLGDEAEVFTRDCLSLSNPGLSMMLSIKEDL